MQTVHFIVNPFSGVGKKKNIGELVSRYLDKSKFSYEIVYTKFGGHATALAKAAADAGVDIVVAVGGDGSVNEVAAGLIGTQTILGIVPGGSGNGLAMHLGWGRNIEKAIQNINTATTKTIDTCTLNDRPFVNLAGVGFDGWVAIHLKQNKYRGFKAYLYQSITKAFTFESQHYEIILDGKKIERECLVVEVANGPMFGYNFEIAPLAKVDDGKLEVMIVKKSPLWRYLFAAPRMLTQSAHKSVITERFAAEEVIVRSQDKQAVHIDGEGFFEEGELRFKIYPASLRVLVPRV